jgi:hypothetical protein
MRANPLPQWWARGRAYRGGMRPPTVEGLEVGRYGGAVAGLCFSIAGLCPFGAFWVYFRARAVGT